MKRERSENNRVDKREKNGFDCFKLGEKNDGGLWFKAAIEEEKKNSVILSIA